MDSKHLYPYAAAAVATLVVALNASAAGLSGGSGGGGVGGRGGLSAGALAGRAAALPSAPSSLAAAVEAVGPGAEVKPPGHAANEDGGGRRGDGPDGSFTVQTPQGRKPWSEVAETLRTAPQAPLPVGSSSPEQPSNLREPAESELRHALEARAAKAEVRRDPPPEARRDRKDGAGEDAAKTEDDDAAPAAASTSKVAGDDANLVAAVGKLQSVIESLRVEVMGGWRRAPQEPGMPWGWIVAAALAGNLAARVGRRSQA